jgi:hypothetical protein
MRALLVAFVAHLLIGAPLLADDPLPQGGDHPAVARYRHRPHKVAVTGVVTDAKGRPIPNAAVYAYGRQRQNCPFPTVPSLELGKGTTDPKGAFAFDTCTMADTRHQLCVVAPGHGTKFVDFDPDGKAADVGKVALPAERPVKGKVVGPDGKPAAGVTIEVRCLVMAGYEIDWFGSPKPGEVLRPLTAKTAKDGTFDLPGIPPGTLEVWVRIDDERFALFERNPLVGLRQQQGSIPLNDGKEKAVEIKLDAPVYVTGTVTRKDTGAALADAWVGVTFSDIEVPADSHVAAVWVKTDAKGRYKAKCGPWADRVHVYCFAPPGTPCPDWSAGPVEVPKGKAEFDVPVVMPAGILVKGKIVDKASGKPVAHAGYVHIHRRETPKTLNRDDSLRLYWANEYHYRYSAADGSYEQPVIPGESGVVLVKAPDSSFVSHVTSCGEILSGKPGPWWSVVEGQANVETKADAKGLTLDIPLTKGVTAEGTVVGPKGEKVMRGVVFTGTPLHTHSQQLHSEDPWAQPLTGGRFAVPGCDPKAPTELYFFDPEHQWGATVTFDPKADAGKPLAVTLQPCGSAKVRFLDPKKKPVTGPVSDMAITVSAALVIGFKESDPKSLAMAFPQDHFFGLSPRELDPKRYEKLAADKDGIVVYPSLIPGAPYKWVTASAKGFGAGPPSGIAVKIKPGETTDLGDATVRPLELPTEPGK